MAGVSRFGLLFLLLLLGICDRLLPSLLYTHHLDDHQRYLAITIAMVACLSELWLGYVFVAIVLNSKARAIVFLRRNPVEVAIELVDRPLREMKVSELLELRSIELDFVGRNARNTYRRSIRRSVPLKVKLELRDSPSLYPRTQNSSIASSPFLLRYLARRSP